MKGIFGLIINVIILAIVTYFYKATESFNDGIVKILLTWSGILSFWVYAILDKKNKT